MAADLNTALAKQAVGAKFAVAFIDECLSPAFGARSKSETDLLVFGCLIEAGVATGVLSKFGEKIAGEAGKEIAGEIVGKAAKPAVEKAMSFI